MKICIFLSTFSCFCGWILFGLIHGLNIININNNHQRLTSQLPLQEICNLPREPGACSDEFTRWYFDLNTNVCKEFYYTGCEGNENNFETKTLCQTKCSSDTSSGTTTVQLQQHMNCFEARKILVAKTTPDGYVPNCSRDGTYSTTQCNTVTNQCWCVNVQNGQEISGTRISSDGLPLICEGSKKCPVGEPLKNGQGNELFCGQGPRHKDCPDGFECNTHPRGVYAVCCEKHVAPTIMPRIIEMPAKGQWTTSEPKQPKNADQNSFSLDHHEDESLNQLKGNCGLSNNTDYAPNCTPEGFYDWVQCDNSKQNCWCVNPDNGEELEGTRKNGQVHCLECFSSAPLLSRFRPACSMSPLMPSQLYKICPSFVSSCACIDIRNGKEIKGSKVGPGERMPTCNFMPSFKGSCNRTSCTINDFYDAQQCSVPTRDCFCVDPETGDEIEGTRVSINDRNEKPFECPNCLYAKSLALDYLALGAFVVQCTSTGQFHPLQCNNQTGVCLCVYTDGTVVPGTRKLKSEGVPDCKPANRTNPPNVDGALNPVHSPSELESSTIPAFPGTNEKVKKCVASIDDHVKCDSEGYFEMVQCDGQPNGYCWCVDVEHGSEIEGTRKSGNITCQECLASSIFVANVLPKCNRTGNMQTKKTLCPDHAKSCGCMDLPGHDVHPGDTMPNCEFAPIVKGTCTNETNQCTEHGYFVPVQCNQQTCWCVHPESNKKVSNYDFSPEKGVPSYCPKCLQAKAIALEYFLFAFMPDCAENGEFAPVQCDNKTGICFCVDDNGAIVPGSRQVNPAERPQCKKNTNIETSVDQETECLKQVKAANAFGQKQPIVGRFIPKCTQSGDYQPLQCHGSTGHCWCVSANGTEISGTRVGPGNPQPVCNQADLPRLASSPQGAQHSIGVSCSEKVKNLGDNPPPGLFVPQCTNEGKYSPLQCHGSTGHCWCVWQDGVEIEGTRVSPGSPQPICHPTVTSLSPPPLCQLKIKSLGDALRPGAYVPQCTESGSFQPLQCHGSTGQCWCVTEDGSEIKGSRVSPGKPKPQCNKTETPLCQSKIKSLGDAPPPGTYVPQCTESGGFRSLQCHGSTGQCWCVQEDGTEVKGSRVLPGNPQPECNKTKQSICQSKVKSLGDAPPPGSYVPQCTELGAFQPVQCHGSTGQCWCVQEDGTEVKGSRVLPGNPQPECNKTKQSICQSKVNSLGDAPPPGSYIPQCTESGDFQPLQCHGSTGQCWCVQEDGTEIKGSRVQPGNPQPECNKTKQSLCVSKLNSLGDAPPPGSYVPQCTESGGFQPLQCHGSTGQCWCVQEDGTEIGGTRVLPGKPQPDCKQKFGLAQPPIGLCKSKVDNLGGTPPPGTYVPQCSESGDFLSLQCHGSTGQCWCVDNDGKEIEGSRVPLGKPQPDCKPKETPKGLCHEKVKEFGATQPPGAYVPQCKESGEYQPLQCHGSTGQCWCVTNNGTEIPNTRVAPGDQQPTCNQEDVQISNETSRHGTCLSVVKSLGHNPPPGSFIPQCTESGAYQLLQCHPSTGHCWCVNENGIEIEGTNVPPGKPQPECKREESVPSNGLCQSKLKSLGDAPPPGAYMPQCTESGSYQSLQCHGSTGQCWCVKEDGTEIEGTRKGPGLERPSCSSLNDTDNNDTSSTVKVGPCKTVQPNEGVNIGGEFRASCTLNGDYEPKQCHGSTGYCWCVTPDGTEIQGTKRGPGQGDVNCDTAQGFNVTFSHSIEQPPALAKSGKNPNTPKNCVIPKDRGSQCDNKVDNSKVGQSEESRWYFNTERGDCLLFKYAGCGGNGNNFKRKTDCEFRCKPQDGPTCNGDSAWPINNKTSDKLIAKHCADITCPVGYKCRMGWIIPACCNETTEDIFDEAYSSFCPNGNKAYMEKGEGNWFTPYFSDTCDNLLCPKGYACNQTSDLFAKCCQSSEYAIDNDPEHMPASQCPFGLQLNERGSGSVWSCDLNTKCPNGSFCHNFTDATPGVCCQTPKLPASLKKVLAKQNCSNKINDEIDACLVPFSDITKRLSRLAVHASPLDFGSLLPQNATVEALNETCVKYETFKQCTSLVYHTGYCYNHKVYMVNQVLGFACNPQTVSIFARNRLCLQDVIREAPVKECVVQFVQTLKLLNNGETTSFGGLCVSIEKFVACVRPAVEANCTSDMFNVIKEFANRTLDVVFGASCEQVVKDEETELGQQIPVVGECTESQAQTMHECANKFANSSAVSQRFSPHLDTPTLLATRQQIDSLDQLCLAYEEYYNCSKPVLSGETKCRPFLYGAVVDLLGFSCRAENKAKWKRHGPCLSEMINRTDVHICFAMLDNAQKNLNVSQDVQPPLEKLCALTDRHLDCMKPILSVQCGKETFQFYNENFANSKQVLFAPCLSFQVENPDQSIHEGGVDLVTSITDQGYSQTVPFLDNNDPGTTDLEQLSTEPTENATSDPPVQGHRVVVNISDKTPPNGEYSKIQITTSSNFPRDPELSFNETLKEVCTLRRDSLLWANAAPSSQYVPQCKDNGDFAPVQCNPSNGTCWCVDEIDGTEIPGTVVHTSENKNATCGPCHKARNSPDVSSESGKSYIPVCQANGKYQPLQCSVESGDCWCVETETGKEIARSKVGPGKTLPTCGVREVYSCSRLPLKDKCLPNGSKPQEVFRWYRDGAKCKIYRFNYCVMEAHVPPYPLKNQKDCERLCVGKHLDFVPVEVS